MPIAAHPQHHERRDADRAGVQQQREHRTDQAGAHRDQQVLEATHAVRDHPEGEQRADPAGRRGRHDERRRSPRDTDRLIKRDLVHHHPGQAEQEEREPGPDQPEVRGRQRRSKRQAGAPGGGRLHPGGHHLALGQGADVRGVVAHQQRAERQEQRHDREARDDERDLPAKRVDHHSHRRQHHDAAERGPRPENAEGNPTAPIEPPRNQRLEGDEEHHLAEHAVDGRVDVPLPQLARRREQSVGQRRGRRAEQDHLARPAYGDPVPDQRAGQAAREQRERDRPGDLPTGPAELRLERFDVEADGPERDAAAEGHRCDQAGEQPPAVVDLSQAGWPPRRSRELPRGPTPHRAHRSRPRLVQFEDCATGDPTRIEHVRRLVDGVERVARGDERVEVQFALVVPAQEHREVAVRAA